jgi:hypothetical protein
VKSKKGTRAAKSPSPIKRGYGSELLSTSKEVDKRRAADTKRAQKGLLSDLQALQNQTHRPKLDKLASSSSPSRVKPADPHADLVLRTKAPPTEPSVVSTEPSLVEVQRYRQVRSGQ